MTTTIENRGIVYSVYQVKGQWKVAHCRNVRRPLNPGPAVVLAFDSETEALEYVRGTAA